jgi:hypothetical protein
MFITKKHHDRIVADLKTSLKNSEDWVEEMRKQRDAAQKLAGVLEKLADKAQKFDTFASGSLNFKSELSLPDNVPVYVDDYFGGKVIKQEATKVIEISADGDIKTGVTKCKADNGYGYVLVLNPRGAK